MPLLALSLAFLCGIILGDRWPLPAGAWFGLAILALAARGLCAWLSRAATGPGWLQFPSPGWLSALRLPLSGLVLAAAVFISFVKNIT
jgi:hypothetical protein